MKHNLLKSVILSVILLMGVTNAWAYNFGDNNGNNQVTIWFDNSTTQLSEIEIYFWQSSGHNVDWAFTHISGTDYWYINTNFANFAGFKIHGKPKNSTDEWGWETNERHDEVHSGWYARCVSPNSANKGSEITWTIPGLKNVNFINTTTAENVLAGAGTNSNPYIIKPATNITVKLTGDLIDNQCSKSYKFGTSNASTTQTYTVNSSATAGSAYNIEGFTGATRDTYTSRYASAGTLYFKTAYNISASVNGGHGTVAITNGGEYVYQGNTTFQLTATPEDGYEVDTWSVSGGTKTGTGNTITITAANNSDVTVSVTFKATEYSITYNELHGVSHSNPVTYTIESKTITFTNPTSARTGYDFAGWDPASIAQGSTGNKTVTAQWTPKTYTVDLNQEEATEQGTSSVTATYNTAMPKIDKLPTRTGYTFDGYFTEKNGDGTRYYNANGTSARTWNIAENRILYAKWTPITYIVKFNGNGSTSGSMSDQSFTYDEAAKALTTNAFKKTGYTFARWNTAENGSGTSYADKATVRNLTTTNNATINLYAQWTINQYTLNYSAGAGGSVKGNYPSGTKHEYNTEITLTAIPEEGYDFVKWIESSTQRSTDITYTFHLTENKNLQAVFAPPTTVYLKAEESWIVNDACFAIEATANGKASKRIDMEPIDCEGHFYANIPSGYTEFEYLRLNPNNKETVWNRTGTLNVAESNGKMYVAPRIYFKPDENWKKDGARFAIYFWKSQADGTCWRDLEYIGNDLYTCIHPGESLDRAIICRMNGGTQENNWDNRWNQTNDLRIDKETIQGKNLYTVTKMTNDHNGDIGEWSTHLETYSAPTYSVTLDPFRYGTYGVEINGKTYLSQQFESVVINNVAAGTQVTVIDAVANTTQYGPKLNPTSGEPWYDCSVVVTPNSSATVKHSVDKVNGVPQHTVCGHTTFTPNMVTTASHRVYLHIPTSLEGSWKASGANNYVWATEYLSNEKQDRPGTLVTMTKDTYLSGKGDGEYWYADIPAGYNKFYFERKDTDKGGRIKGTEWFIYGIPLNNINCYTLTGNTGNDYTGIREVTPTSVGDYRLLYVEQEVRKSNLSGNEWKTVVANTYNHPSDVVKPHTTEGTYKNIVSLHVYKDKTIDGKTCNPEVILQMCTEATYNNGNGKWTYTWRDIEAHMVNGPLEAEPGMAMLPGRKKAAEGSDCDDFVYDDGIEIIKNDKKVGRVWNFTIQQFKSPTTQKDTARLLLDTAHLKPYEGNYYIRTNNADGGWSNYTIPANHMNHSHYAEANSGYSHYFCKWINIDQNNTIGTHKNVKFIVANDYGVAISKELAQDAFTDEDGNLKQHTNVRWSWNQYTNEAKRAYIQGSQDAPQDFLTTTITDKNSATNKTLFEDNGNWIYESNIKARVGDKLTAITAPYPHQEPINQEFLEERYQQDGGLVMLTGDESNPNVYDVRVMFDFKINKTTVFLVPNDKVATTAIDVLIERVDHGQATQVKTKAAVTAADQEKGVTVHAAMTFTEDNVANLNNNKSQRLFYWVSFPFDVRISDVFGFGEYGVHWIMQYYDGEERAQKGCWADSPTYWRYVTDTANLDNSTTLNSGILKANQGYVLALATNIANMGVFTYTDQVSLYFPSYKPIKNINDQVIETAVTLPEYKCTINRPTPDGDRRFKDSNWHLIGIPSYADKTRQLTQEGVLYYYVREYKTDDYAVTEYKNSAVDVTFQSMHSYFVQFAGTINWAEESWTLNAPEQMAAKRNANYKSNEHTLRVELQQSNEKADQTYIRLQEEATPAFDMNKDLTKVINSGANIYSLITTEETPIEVAGNVLPVGESIIPLGVKTSKAGEYTFAMPDGTDGIIVELIDYETNTRTNMTLDEYTVNLGKGTFETRFALHVKPDKTVTSVEDINTNSDGVRKFIIDGVLYMQKDGMLYDAQGKLVR